jgi:hypothetical protein
VTMHGNPNIHYDEDLATITKPSRRVQVEFKQIKQ